MNHTGLSKINGIAKLKHFIFVGFLLSILIFPVFGLPYNATAHSPNTLVSSGIGEDNINGDDNAETQEELVGGANDPEDDMPPILVIIVVLVVLGTALLLASSLLRREP